jgi:4-hydroxyacetophenone monooxygenase
LLKRDNVELVTTRASHLTETSLFGKDGSEAADLDIIVWATGFQSTKFLLPAMNVVGRGGVSLSDFWGEAPSAYLGVAVPEFPNFYMTYGPNTNVGSGGSICWVAENQARYITQNCVSMIRNGIRTMEVKRNAFDSYNDLVEKKMSSTVWTDPGCSSWYKVGKEGKVVGNCPWSLEEYCSLLRQLDPDHFVTTSCQGESGSSNAATAASTLGGS